jgi:hypothetical protein
VTTEPLRGTCEVDQVVECLFSKHEALNSNPSTTKNIELWQE